MQYTRFMRWDAIKRLAAILKALLVWPKYTFLRIRTGRVQTFARAFRPSEVLALELLQVINRMRWNGFATELLHARASHHINALRHYDAMEQKVALHPGNQQRTILAMEHATRVAEELRKTPPYDSGKELRKLLDDFHDITSEMPIPVIEEIDHHLEVQHRRFVVEGVVNSENPGETTVATEIQNEPVHPHALVGLALSGGGIRSASFSIGAIQALARSGLLPAFHYMSSVSGGGYAASWLSAWAYRHERGIHGVEDEIFTRGGSEPGPLRWIRRHSSYLVPRLGSFLSSDIWTLLVAYISNWLPILLLVCLSAFALVLFPHLLVAIYHAAALMEFSPSLVRVWLWLAAGILALFIGYARGLTLFYRTPKPVDRYPSEVPYITFWGSLMVSLIFVFTVSVFHKSLSIFDIAGVANYFPATTHRILSALQFALVVGFCSMSVAYFSNTAAAQGLKDRFFRPNNAPREHRPFSCSAPIYALIVLVFVSTIITSVVITLTLDAIVARSSRQDFLPIVAFGPIFVLTTLAIAELSGSLFMLRFQRDMDRAFSARVGGWMLASAAGWTLLSCVSLYGYRINTAGTFTLAVIASIAAALEIITWWLVGVASALLLAVGLVFAFVVGQVLIPVIANAPKDSHATYMFLAMLFVIGCTFGLARLANVNRFSLHSLYKEGLVRTFLGASRLSTRNPSISAPNSVSSDDEEHHQYGGRRPDPMTDIDDDDDPGLSWMQCRQGRELPVLLLNAAVNGRSLTDHEGRVPRQWSYTFSQFYSGSPVTGIGYTETGNYSQAKSGKGITLGTAMAVSGAAMSPTAGRTTQPLRSFILGILNARLGIWIGNPRFPDAVESDKPPLAGFTVLREMLGFRSKFSRWIHLSDGGHFENLGLYELIRRGCRRVILIDATCDPDGNFSDMANAIRRAKIDLGVTIKRGKTWAKFQQDGKKYSAGKSSHGGWTWFDIDYGEGLPRGRILYIKPSTRDTEKLEVEVRHYWKKSRAFPHEPTADQFFGEEQMEAYRALGEEISWDAIKTVLVPAKPGVAPQYDQDPRLMEILLRAAKAKHKLYVADEGPQLP